MQRFHGHEVVGREVRLPLRDRVVVARADFAAVVAVTTRLLQREVRETAAHAHQAAPIRRLAPVRRALAREAEPERGARTGAHVAVGFHRQHAREPVAVFRGEAARGEFEAADGFEVENRQRTVGVLHVKRLDQVHAVEAREHLFVRRAPHPEACRQVVRREAGQVRNRAVEIFAELRQREQVGLGERRRERAALGLKVEAARRHDDGPQRKQRRRPEGRAKVAGVHDHLREFFRPLPGRGEPHGAELGALPGLQREAGHAQVHVTRRRHDQGCGLDRHLAQQKKTVRIRAHPAGVVREPHHGAADRSPVDGAANNAANFRRAPRTRIVRDDKLSRRVALRRKTRAAQQPVECILRFEGPDDRLRLCFLQIIERKQHLHPRLLRKRHQRHRRRLRGQIELHRRRVRHRAPQQGHAPRGPDEVSVQFHYLLRASTSPKPLLEPTNLRRIFWSSRERLLPPLRKVMRSEEASPSSSHASGLAARLLTRS